MSSMLCNIWDDFSNWVTLEWSQPVYIIVVCIFALLGVMGLLSFFKGSINKDKKPKWGVLVLSLLMFGLLAIVVAAKFA